MDGTVAQLADRHYSVEQLNMRDIVIHPVLVAFQLVFGITYRASIVLFRLHHLAKVRPCVAWSVLAEILSKLWLRDQRDLESAFHVLPVLTQEIDLTCTLCERIRSITTDRSKSRQCSMSLIIGIRAAEGLVLATDSLSVRDDAVFLSARKLFVVEGQTHLAVAVCGLLSLGRGDLRPITVLMAEFEQELRQYSGGQRLPTAVVGQQLGEFLMRHWRECMPADDTDSETDVILAGIDQGMRYGEIYWLKLPKQPEPRIQRLPKQSFFAGYWGHVPGLDKMTDPYSFPFDIMPIQDAAALAEHLISSTSKLERWSTKPQRTGGPVRLVTITQGAGVTWVSGESGERQG